MSPTKVTKSSLRHVLSKGLGEERWEFSTRSGLHVSVAPRRGFAASFAMLTFKFGALDMGFTEASGKRVRLPHGTAHFLEHQLFKKHDGDLADLFASRGAYANAQTSHRATSYHVESVSCFEDNLETLFRLGFEPYFARQSVELERDIILRELASYQDHPDWVCYQNLLKALYHKHPVRIDIVGDEESIDAIGARTLERAHTHFYQPRNAGLFLAGDFDPQHAKDVVEQLCEAYAPSGTQKLPHASKLKEPKSPQRARISSSMYTSLPRLMLGYKDVGMQTLSAQELTRRELMAGIALDLLYGRGTTFFDALYGDGIVTGSFSATYHGERDVAYVSIGGETPKPEALEERVLERLDGWLDAPLPSVDLERKKRKVLGRFLRNFESCESTAFVHSDAWTSGVDVFDYPELVESIQASELQDLVDELFCESARATSLVTPRQ